MRQRSTLKDLARETGLAVSTVSAICRGKGSSFRIARTTQKRVLETAEKIGYRRNSLAFFLRTGKSTFVPVLGRTFRVPITQERQNHIAQLLLLSGFQPILYDFHWFDGSEEKLLEAVEEIPVAGLIVSDVHIPSLHKHLLSVCGRTPCILIDSEQHQGFDHVYLDRSMVSYLAAWHLLEKGYKKIVYTIPERSSFCHLTERTRGFIRAFREFGREVNQENFLWLTQKESSYQMGWKIGQKITENGSKPEAVMALNDQVALGLISYLEKKGIRVPEDIAVVGSENLPEGEYRQLPLTTVDFKVTEISRQAVDLLQRRISGDWSDFPKEIVIWPELIVRASCGCHKEKQ